MPFDLQNTNYDNLLEDPMDEQEVVEPTVEEEEVPLIPDYEEETDTTEESNTEPTYSGVVAEYLKSYGIEDPSKIQFENDEG